ncbi:hypothetical protein GGS23DRAFT_592014 [Durotheca rogersii]|uniref:uncharacterized protein n=1 Tax=Durotheca rogersii TaxID=419775 RepID=UPI00221E7E19|nr:uncharacterized protein GGS23DRAFT_592014 [Durotheca rogersii]KAI5868224.1 hypothetical protein GGS23DRAFT_592014 [Durotheca rogersii]
MSEPTQQFSLFQQMPPEVRAMIWTTAVRGQDRLVMTDSLTRVTRAPCPTLFLVCFESYMVARMCYTRLPGGDLHTDEWLPPMHLAPAGGPGPVVSFANDIFDIGAWLEWTGENWYPAFFRYVLLAALTYLPAYTELIQGALMHPRFLGIERLSARGVRRVAVPIWRAQRTKLPECLFFRSSLLPTWIARALRPLGVAWAWEWAAWLEEVWVVREDEHTGAPEARIMFPPAAHRHCCCVLCVGVAGETWVNGSPFPEFRTLAPRDRAGHDMIFSTAESANLDLIWHRNLDHLFDN